MPVQTIFVAFFAVWVALSAASWILYSRGSLATKRRLHPWMVFGSGALFAAFVLVLTQGRAWPIVPVIALISILNYRLTRFCDRCGNTVRVGPFAGTSHCPKCGADIRKPSSGAKAG